jgi:hypothetical protein
VLWGGDNGEDENNSEEDGVILWEGKDGRDGRDLIGGTVMVRMREMVSCYRRENDKAKNAACTDTVHYVQLSQKNACTVISVRYVRLHEHTYDCRESSHLVHGQIDSKPNNYIHAALHSFYYLCQKQEIRNSRRDRQRETERETERERQRERKRDRERDRERETGRQSERNGSLNLMFVSE